MPCNDTAYYSFTAEVLCDEEITEQGEAKVISVDDAVCDVKIVVAHAAGCPVS